MHFTNIFGVCMVMLASTTAAMPHVTGPYHGQRIAIEVPTNSTGAHNATSTGTRGSVPLSTGRVHSKHYPSHGLNSVDKEGKGANHCNELCSLEAQTCTIATPDDDKFCWKLYNRCIHKCRPDDFQ